jgi:hypothetical protein
MTFLKRHEFSHHLLRDLGLHDRACSDGYLNIRRFNHSANIWPRFHP